MIPNRVAKLRVDKRGYPVPWFVADIDGVPDFRVIAPGRTVDALRFELCWICGERRGRYSAFVIGPMCTVNRVSAEPPSHLDCAMYAATLCPFLTHANMTRRTSGLPDEGYTPGVMIERNPGVTAIWVTKSFTPFMAPVFAPDAPATRGVLIDIGVPESVLWYACGRAATREEVAAAVESGLPLLMEQAKLDGDDAVAALLMQAESAIAYLPQQDA